MNKLSRVNNDFNGFSQLIDLYEENRDIYFETIDIDIEFFFAANMCAPLAAILDKFISNIPYETRPYTHSCKDCDKQPVLY